MTHPTAASLHHPHLHLCVTPQAALTHQAGGNVLLASVPSKQNTSFLKRKRSSKPGKHLPGVFYLFLMRFPGREGAKPIAAQVLGADVSLEPVGCRHSTAASLLPGNGTYQGNMSGFLSGPSPASQPSYRVIKRPCESLLEKNVLQKLNLTQSQKHILGFMAQSSRDRQQAKKQICSPTCSKASTAQRDGCAGNYVSDVGRELHRGHDRGFKYQL